MMKIFEKKWKHGKEIEVVATYVLAPHYKIVYWVEDKYVKVTTVFDTRQAPEKLTYIIRDTTSWVCEDPVEYIRRE